MEIGETVYNGVKSLGGDEWTPIYKSYSIIYAMDGTKSNPSQVTVSSDDGQTVYNLNFSSMANNWSDGLVLSAQRKSANGQTTFRTTASTWTQDDPLKTFILNPRVISQTNTLDSGQSTPGANHLFERRHRQCQFGGRIWFRWLGSPEDRYHLLA